MSEVLYRKYRPQSFAEVVGQEEVVGGLERAIKQGKVAHSYIFAGGRGIGKTTIARILAKAIGTHSDDIYELDAASNRGIDEIRSLREAVNVLPLHSPYKVYILDEAHMLTKEAANALLKTLEEPPAHCVFILATTELDKFLDTVISRCEVYQFKQPSLSVLIEQIKEITRREKKEISTISAELVALHGKGSFRDTLSILQKVLAGVEKKVDDEMVRQILGVPSGELVHQFIDSLQSKDTNGALLAINEIKGKNLAADCFCDLVLDSLRKILLLRFAKALQEQIKNEVGEDEFNYLMGKANDAGAGISSVVLAELLKARAQVEWAAIPELPLELFIINNLSK